MKIVLAEYDFTGKNLASEVQINTANGWTATELLDVLVDVVLGITGGRIAGAGATYTLTAKITRTIAGTAETIVLAKEQWVNSLAANTPIQCSLRFPVQPGDIVKIYALSSSASDVDVDGAIFCSAYNDLTELGVRDALKLAPSAGAPSAGSVDKHLDDLSGADGKAVISTDAQDLSATLSVNAKKLDGNTPNNLAAGALMGLVNDAITADKFDETTAFPLKSQDASTTVLARQGDKMDLVDSPNATGVGVIVTAIWSALTNGMIVAGSVGKKIADWVVLTSQSVRDAMKLAPSAGSPAAGSVDKLLDDVPTVAEIDDQLAGTHGDGQWDAMSDVPTVEEIATAVFGATGVFADTNLTPKEILERINSFVHNATVVSETDTTVTIQYQKSSGADHFRHVISSVGRTVTNA